MCVWSNVEVFSTLGQSCCFASFSSCNSAHYAELLFPFTFPVCMLQALQQHNLSRQHCFETLLHEVQMHPICGADAWNVHTVSLSFNSHLFSVVYPQTLKHIRTLHDFIHTFFRIVCFASLRVDLIKGSEINCIHLKCALCRYSCTFWHCLHIPQETESLRSLWCGVWLMQLLSLCVMCSPMQWWLSEVPLLELI